MADLRPAADAVADYSGPGSTARTRSSVTSDEGFYDYVRAPLQGWTAGWDYWLTGAPPGTYVVELVDGAGQSWGQSAPLTVPTASTPRTPRRNCRP